MLLCRSASFGQSSMIVDVYNAPDLIIEKVLVPFLLRRPLSNLFR